MSFETFGLHPALLRGVADLGFSIPTPIQSRAIPVLLEGKDALGRAMTGSGKTAAFLLPIMQKLIDRPKGGTRALILTPTRELALQIDEQFRALARHAKLSGTAILGGMPMGAQVRTLRAGVDVVVATPGRLLDHLREGSLNLKSLEIVVLDEADRMLDVGFLPDVKRVLQFVPAKRQTLLFSATLPPEILKLSREILHEAVTIDVTPAVAPKPASGVTQACYPVPQELKSALLVELLKRGEIGSVIAFTRTKHRANRLADYLERHGVAAARIHGNRSQAQRNEALAGLKEGRVPVLVATDIAARGIDVQELSHVVNFDVPASPEDYVHRVGRTARAEATGDAFLFVSPDEEPNVARIERVIGQRLRRVIVPGFDYHARPSEKLEIPLHERLAKMRAERNRGRDAGARRGPSAPPSGARPSTGRGQQRPSGYGNSSRPGASGTRSTGSSARPGGGSGRRFGRGGPRP